MNCQNCRNCGVGITSFSIYIGYEGKHTPKYGDCCSFICSAELSEADRLKNPSSYEMVTQVSASGSSLTYYKKKSINDDK